MLKVLPCAFVIGLPCDHTGHLLSTNYYMVIFISKVYLLLIHTSDLINLWATCSRRIWWEGSPLHQLSSAMTFWMTFVARLRDQIERLPRSSPNATTLEHIKLWSCNVKYLEALGVAACSVVFQNGELLSLEWNGCVSMCYVFVFWHSSRSSVSLRFTFCVPICATGRDNNGRDGFSGSDVLLFGAK